MKVLRPYQKDCIEKLKESFGKFTKHLIVLPTGSGKTFTITSFLRLKNKKALFIAHTVEILDQTRREFCKNLEPDSFEVMSIQKANRNLKYLVEQNFEIIIIDECHRAAAKSYIKLVQTLQKRKVHLIGLTATPFRSDKKSIYEIFGLPIFSRSILDLIEERYLCDFKGFRIRTNTSLKGISTKEGDFITAKLSAVINVKNRNDLILKEYKKLPITCKVVVFCAGVEHAKTLNNLFIENGIDSGMVYGSLEKLKRDKIIYKFKKGELKIIFNCQILTEGFDEPSIDTIFMCRPTLSKTLYMQMIGRGARLSPNKSFCNVYEFTDNDYDVCSIEDILDKPEKKYLINHGESLKDYSKRIKELEDEGIEIHKEEIKIIRKSFQEKEATSWQLDHLRKYGIKFKLPLSEHSANILLGAKNGSNFKKN